MTFLDKTADNCGHAADEQIFPKELMKSAIDHVWHNLPLLKCPPNQSQGFLRMSSRPKELLKRQRVHRHLPLKPDWNRARHHFEE